ncbi:hypothetical protein AAG906_010976 [Vitis piasezkii]
MQEYIVYMGSKPAGDFSASAIHIDMLQQVFGSRASNSLVRSYKRSFNGFVAKLTEEEMQQMKAPHNKVMGFRGVSQQVKRTSVESDIIIGVLDSGIWPESDSFDDEGFGPPPSKWIGTCQGFSNFTCNNKIIGAKYYRSSGQFGQEDLQSPRDSDGHGTHTASTAAGLGFPPKNYFADPIAIGAFHAMKNGVLTSTSAGNDGPVLASITNFSPWSLSVAASTIDRDFFTKVQLGDSNVFEGVSINTFELNDKYPLIYGGDAPNTAAGFSGNSSRFCFPSTLNPNLVTGKIVLCDIETNGTGAFLAGAFSLPASHLSARDGSSIANYINSTSNPTASIFKSTEVSDALAPYIVSFSSRPDIAAPGVRILAAWPPIAPVSGVKVIIEKSAYIKSFNPTWSPAAIKSALMTTATPMSAKQNREAEFAYGAGNIDPVKAIDPGLVYDADEIDYVKYLCGLGYSTRALRLVTGDNSVCSAATNGTVWNLNYPSFALSSLTKESITGMFNRTVTNVGSSVSTYKATVIGAPEGLDIQKLSFVLKVEGKVGDNIVSASLVWDDGVHQVRTPIVVLALT